MKEVDSNSILLSCESDFQTESIVANSSGSSFTEMSAHTTNNMNGTFSPRKVLRKLRGFVLDISQREEFATVVFVKDGDEYRYEVRAELLTRNKITCPGQPFEFIEEITKAPDGMGTCLVHRYTPSASESAAVKSELPFDDETRKKLKSLLAN